MRLVVLGSGSGGNAVVVEEDGRYLLLDAGFSCRELERRMAAVGIDPRKLSAVVVTHEHDDHVRGLDRLARRHHLPIYGTAGTLEACAGLSEKAAAQARAIASGWPVEIAGFVVEPFQVPHDAREPIGLVVEGAGGGRVGLVTDVGSRSQLAWARLSQLDLLILESNHDLDMLRNGPYPWVLKQRVAGRHGHLSNRDAADGLPELLCDRLRRVALYHLSQINNRPELALAEVSETLAREGARVEVELTWQDRPTPWLEVTP